MLMENMKGASFYTFTVEKVTQILGIRDDLFTVAQDPIVLEVSASHSVLGEHLHTLLDHGGDEIVPPIAVVTL